MSGGHEAWLASNGERVRALARSEEGSEQRRGRASEGEGELGHPLLEGIEVQ